MLGWLCQELAGGSKEEEQQQPLCAVLFTYVAL